MRTPRSARVAVVAVIIAATVGAPTAAAGDIVIRRDGSKAVDDVPAPPAAPTSPEAAEGFHLDDAGVGAAGMLALGRLTAGGDLAARPAPPRSRVVTGRATR